MTTTDPATLEAELLRLMELEAAASPGNWRAVPITGGPEDLMDVVGYRPPPCWRRSSFYPSDAALIVAMRNALPALLAAFEQQRAEITRLTEALRVARAQGEKPL